MVGGYERVSNQAYAATYPNDVQLVEAGAGHDLNGQLDVIWEHVQPFLLRAKGDT